MFKKLAIYSVSDTHVIEVGDLTSRALVIERSSVNQLAIVTLAEDDNDAIDCPPHREVVLNRTFVFRLNMVLPANATAGAEIGVTGELVDFEGNPVEITDSFVVPITSDRPVELRTIDVVDGQVDTTFTLDDTGYYEITEQGLNSRLADDNMYIMFSGAEIVISK